MALESAQSTEPLALTCIGALSTIQRAHNQAPAEPWKSAPHKCTGAPVLHAHVLPALIHLHGAKEYEGRPAWMEQRRATNTQQQRGALWKQVIRLPKPLKGGSQLSSTHGRYGIHALKLLCGDHVKPAHAFRMSPPPMKS